ncbi:MAG: alpha/beta fold hydrolase [Deltaproteobacteria bacterium]|nr:alpha/beta fold hydrolase [Deltaproteobacteria bacterium]
MSSRVAAIIRALKAMISSPVAWLALITTSAAIVSLIWLLRVRAPGAERVRGGADPCQQVLSDLRDRNFADVVAQSDAAIRAQLSPDQLQSEWETWTSGLGSLSEWKVAESQFSDGLQTWLYDVTFERGSLPVSITVNKAGEVAGLWFYPARNSQPASIPPYANARAFKAEQTTVGAAPHLCGAILTIPTIGSPPFPAAVLVSGSAPHDKDETFGPNHPFADIAEGLSARGIAVLRYDKRTWSHIIDFASLTIEQEYREDAVAAVALLRSRPDIDHKRIFVIGHSEGAVLAPDIARRAAPMAGVVMLAPMGAAPLLDTAIRELRYLGASSALIVENEKIRQEINSGKLPPDRMVALLGVPVGYIRDLNRRDEIGVARHLGVPILILHGSRDYQVVHEDIAAWRSGLKGTPDVTFREFPGLNHLFMAGSGPPGPAEYANASHVAEPVVLTIADFILQQPSIASNSGLKPVRPSEQWNRSFLAGTRQSH